MTTSSSTVTELNPVAVLLRLSQSKEWQVIRTLMSTSSPDCLFNLACSITLSSENKLEGMTLLHAVVRSNPPLDIVAKIIRVYPEMLAHRDDFDRTPLHIAADSEVSPMLLKFIARAYPAACDAQDEDGRTPLHYVCDTSSFSYVLFADTNATPQHQEAPKHEAIAALLSESLNAATIEDDDEMSPLEHAIMCEASLKTVKLLQVSARNSLRSRARLASPNLLGASKRRKVLGAFGDGTNY